MSNPKASVIDTSCAEFLRICPSRSDTKQTINQVTIHNVKFKTLCPLEYEAQKCR